MALKHTLKSPVPKSNPAKAKASAAPAAPTLRLTPHASTQTSAIPAAPTMVLRVDAVEVLDRFATELDDAAGRAERAVLEGRPRDAVLAAGDMQSLLRAWNGRLADALAQARSKRVSPAVRQAARDTAQRILPDLAAHIRAMEARIRVHRARQEAIGAALRAAATTPAGVYGASLRYGVQLKTRNSGHTLGVTI